MDIHTATKSEGEERMMGYVKEGKPRLNNLLHIFHIQFVIIYELRSRVICGLYY